ncbi:MAG: hypothetical protein HC869_11705, partial [Rhodospirillales bacterium]|nr:hypothetical protein [Rhodospirillales bacterium]
MKISFSKIELPSSGAVVVGVYEDRKLTPTAAQLDKQTKGAIERALELIDQTPGAWMPQQFENPANIAVHARTTAQEILADFAEYPLSMPLITGVGTGGISPA